MSTVPQPWYSTLYLLDSHLPLFFFIYESINRHALSPIMGPVNAIGWLILGGSFSYHLCVQTGYCAFGASVLVEQQIDNILAFSAIPVASFLITDIGYKETRIKRSLFVNLLFFTLTWGATIALVLTGLNDESSAVTPGRALTIVTMNVGVFFLKLVLADESRLSLRDRFSEPRIIIAILFLIIAVICFEINAGEEDWITHGTWHWLDFLALSLLIPQAKQPPLPSHVS